MASLLGVPFLSASIHNISHILPLLFYLTHKCLKKERSIASSSYTFRHSIQRKVQPNFPQKLAINDQQKSIQRPRWQKIKNPILHLSISILFLPINFLSMSPNKRCSLHPHILSLQLIDQLKVIMLPLIIIGKHIDEQSQDLGHQISEDDGNGDKDEDHKDTLYWVFGCDIAIGDCCDHCYAEVHDVCVHLRPGQDESHVVECPAVVYPAEVRSVGTVVVVAVDPPADQVEGYAHVMGVNDQNCCQFDAEIGGVERDVELCHSLELDIDTTDRVKFHQPYHFNPISVNSVHQQRNDHCQPRSHIDEHLQVQIVAQND